MQLQRLAGNIAVSRLAGGTTAHKTLRPGDSGNDVLIPQDKLTTAGVDPPVKHTSAYDAQTDQGVRRFQQSKKLGVDGVYGPQTSAALDTVTAGRAMDEAGLASFAARKAQADTLREAGAFAAAEPIYAGIYSRADVPAMARTGITFSRGSCAQALGRFADAIGFYEECLGLPSIGEDLRLDADQRIKECRLGKAPGTLESTLNEAAT